VIDRIVPDWVPDWAIALVVWTVFLALVLFVIVAGLGLYNPGDTSYTDENYESCYSQQTAC